MISAVDLLKGIAVGTSMKKYLCGRSQRRPGYHYEGKADAALKALLEDGCDFVYVHVEAPDEMGHQGSIEKKIKAIEYLDQRVVARIKEGMDASGEDYRMLVLPDHPVHLCEDAKPPILFLCAL